MRVTADEAFPFANWCPKLSFHQYQHFACNTTLLNLRNIVLSALIEAIRA